MSMPGGLMFKTKKDDYYILLYNPIKKNGKNLIIIKQDIHFRTLEIQKGKVSKIIKGDFSLKTVYYPEFESHNIEITIN